jgi:hypothetical protein
MLLASFWEAFISKLDRDTDCSERILVLSPGSLNEFCGIIRGNGRSQWSRCLRRGSAAARLLGLRVRIPLRHGCSSLVFVVCCVGQWFSNFFCYWPPLLAWFICVAPCVPPPFADAPDYEKKLHYLHSVDLYIRITLYYVYLQYCIVFTYFV